eukprot:GFUD01027980.1.p1 GENE.GFUD01027980.1~~GFUD01027980.1.p1  ORF type:complete len:354 (-),score=61.57 GFUD01027980.1:63-1124(-)
MAAKDQMKKGIFAKKDHLLSDVSKVYREGLYSDITFIMADDVSVSTNRFMLACRVPYFATLLFGELSVNQPDNSVTLNCCNSETFQQIMNYVWEGEISFSELNLQSLLDLLETSRFFCLEPLVEGVLEYLEYLLDSQKVESTDCLAALDFLILHNFARASDLFLAFIDQNLSSISLLPEFGKYFYPTSDIFDGLEKHLEKLEEDVDSNECELAVQNKQIEAMPGQIEAQRKQVNESEAFNFSLDPILDSPCISGSGFEYKFMLPRVHFINNAEFKFDNSNFRYSYTLKSSLDGVTWTDLLDCNLVEHTGQQKVHFMRREMKTLAIKVTGSKNIDGYGDADPKPTISGAFASMI